MTDRIAVLAALADPHRLALVDALADGDLAPGELGARAGLGSSLLAHHLRVLEAAGAVTRRRSAGDGRRAYLSLVGEPLVEAALAARPGPGAGGGAAWAPKRVLFVSTAGAGRAPLAAALLAARRIVPTACAGTDPAPRLHPLALDALERLGLSPVALAPAALEAVREDGDLMVAVDDAAYESHGAHLHWSVPDPAAEGTTQAFGEALATLAARVDRLAAALATAPDRVRRPWHGGGGGMEEWRA